jgi:arsenate reductase
LAIAALGEVGIDISGHRSKAVSDLDTSTVDAVVTLCAEQVCPVFPRHVAKFHWPLPDPARENTAEAFAAVRDELFARLRLLFAPS